MAEFMGSCCDKYCEETGLKRDQLGFATTPFGPDKGDDFMLGAVDENQWLNPLAPG